MTRIRDFLNLSMCLCVQVRDWILPDDFDLPRVEAHHLVVTVDADDDDKLTKVRIDVAAIFFVSVLIDKKLSILHTFQHYPG